MTDTPRAGRLGRRPLLGLIGRAAALPFAASVAGAAPAVAADRPPFRIYRITYRGRTAVEEGFESYLAANNVPVTYIDRDAARDPARVPGFVEEIRELRPDLVYTWGTSVTLGVAGRYDGPDDGRHIRDLPIVFALVSAPVRSGIVPDRAAPGRNVTGAVHVIPLDIQLRAMAAYRPFTRLGVLYTPTEPNSIALVDQLRTLQASLGFTLITRAFALDADGRPTVEGAEARIAEIKAAGADWLYLLPDTFLGTQYHRVVPAALAEALPTFGAAELAIRRGGALAALISRYTSVGRLAASKAMRILVDRAPPQELPIETLKRFSMIVNMPVAQALEIYPPIEMLNYAEVITK